MKKLIYSFLAIASLFAMPSCMEVDNYDEPDCTIKGTIIDETTGQPYQGAQGEAGITIWEMSYSKLNMYHQHSQSLSIKADGTYTNTKLFKGTYDMVPEGPWWPCDTVFDVKVTKNCRQDFAVTPFLKIKDFKAELQEDGTTLRMSCRLFAPHPVRKEDVLGEVMELPRVKEVRPFISLVPFCGAGSCIGYYNTNEYLKRVNRAFSAIGDVETGEGNDTYTFNIPLKSGYTYYVRMGANVDFKSSPYNYSEVVEIKVP